METDATASSLISKLPTITTTTTAAPSLATTTATTTTTPGPGAPTTATQLVESKWLRVHTFTDEFVDAAVHFQLLIMRDSYFLWMGSGPPLLNTVAFAIATRFESMPSASILTGAGAGGDFSVSLAQRLCKKTGRPFFVSSNFPQLSPELQIYVERRLVKELNTLAKQQQQQHHH
eukprot:TRINITY_DN692_c0_g1_i1.p1 TRINITY_DN692_c0_g1~~TRINITY_DN692_c0_g1_i1.p1  ORF type:complete len:188 (+),score=65.81 TRINITY_DN692_c0_g1_i1:40-564(+)